MIFLLIRLSYIARLFSFFVFSSCFNKSSLLFILFSPYLIYIIIFFLINFLFRFFLAIFYVHYISTFF